MKVNEIWQFLNTDICIIYMIWIFHLPRHGEKYVSVKAKIDSTAQEKYSFFFSGQWIYHCCRNFDEHLGLSVRNGTDVDQENLLMTLQQLDFEVKVYKDLPYKEIENILERLSRENHSDADCLFVAVLSHGDQELLYAFDQPYKPEQLWGHFNAQKCSTTLC